MTAEKPESDYFCPEAMRTRMIEDGVPENLIPDRIVFPEPEPEKIAEIAAAVEESKGFFQKLLGGN